VGFVRKLPHDLVESFRSTLEEVVEAALLVHVVDASKDPERQVDAVRSVLKQIEAADKPTLMVLNKIDLLSEVEADKLRGRYPDAVFTAAADGIGLDALLEQLSDHLSRLRVEVSLKIPFERGDVVAKVHQEGEVLEETYDEEGTFVVARIPRQELADLEEFVASQSLGG
jgi:GTPase